VADAAGSSDAISVADAALADAIFALCTPPKSQAMTFFPLLFVPWLCVISLRVIHLGSGTKYHWMAAIVDCCIKQVPLDDCHSCENQLPLHVVILADN
jgi:hypothetical protein